MGSAFPAAGLAALLSMAAVTAAAASPPAEAFGNLPAIEGARISPDGGHLAAIEPVDGRPVVEIYDLANPGSRIHSLAMQGAQADLAFWPNDQRLIGIFHANLHDRWSQSINRWSRAVSAHSEGANPTLLMWDLLSIRQNLSTAHFVDFDLDDGNIIYMAAMEEFEGSDGPSLNLYRVDVSSGKSQLVEVGRPGTVQWIANGHGYAFMRVDLDRDLQMHVLFHDEDKWEDLAKFDARGGLRIGFDGLNAKGDALVIEHANAGGMGSLFQLGAKDETELFSNPEYDVATVLPDERTRRVIGAAYAADKLEYRYFDPHMAKLQSDLERALPGCSVNIESMDAAQHTVVVEADGPRDPPALYLYNPATAVLSTFKLAYPDLSKDDLGSAAPYPYTARDGTKLHAYLTLPPGKPARNLPTIVFPHGGPAARDMLAFDWWAQFMASRGYAVLQPNFRGSAGYGSAFLLAGDGQWTGAVLNDLTDGAAKLEADGIADPKRVCVVGASYGGYAALAAATFAPDVFACAVSFAGLSDLGPWLDWVAGSEGDVQEGLSVWERRIGAARSDTAKLQAMSPAHHARNVKIPVLLIHSEKDVTVPIAQSEIENDELRLAGRDVEFVRLSGDDHYLSLPQTRIQLLKEIEKFLAAHIGN
ncbi:MAG TPA: S9 family peptidase [Rhizomicrobium sp.]|jgi:dipeptidyl aminopeptidase/acylaminoacyl peptidase